MNDTYWQIWVHRQKSQLSVYLADIPFESMQLQDLEFIRLVKIKKVEFEFIEIDYTRYLKVFQRAWRRIQHIRKHALKYLRLRELGIRYVLG
jgi:hypothetical protein